MKIYVFLIFCRVSLTKSQNMDPEALKNMSPAQQQEIISAVQQQVALANMQARRISRKEKLFLIFNTAGASAEGD